MFKAAWLQKGDPDLHFWLRNLNISYIGKMLTYFLPFTFWYNAYFCIFLSNPQIPLTLPQSNRCAKCIGDRRAEELKWISESVSAILRFVLRSPLSPP